jgi:hypothetical protein
MLKSRRRRWHKTENGINQHFPSSFWASHLPGYSKPVIFYNRGNEMAAKVKPVQPTEIKNKKIASEVIEQIRKPIPGSVYKRHEKLAKHIDKMFRK